MRKLQTKDNRKANTGITLITLVITIAVLAILAGVSLNAILGDDGILDIAQQRSDETQEKTAKSEMQQLVLEYQLSRSEETLEEFLKEKIPDRIDKVTNNGDNTLTMEKDGYKMVVNNVAGIPKITVGTANVVANGDGTGEALGEASTYLGNTLYITFSHSITGGTTTVEPPIPYTVTENGTYTFTVTGTVNEKEYVKKINVTVDQFKPITITYDANGGSNSPNEQKKDMGVNATLTSQIPKKEGYSFKSWNTMSDGSGVSFERGATYTQDESIKLYAQWKQMVTKTYSVGSTSSSSSEVYTGGTTREIISYGNCNIIPTKFTCLFQCGNVNATKTSTATFTVQGYTNGEWKTIFTKTATRPTYGAQYTVYEGTENYNTSEIYTDFKVIFTSTDNERLVYGSILIY